GSLGPALRRRSVWPCGPASRPGTTTVPANNGRVPRGRGIRPSSREQRKIYGSRGGRNHYFIVRARVSPEPLKNQCSCMRTFHRVFGHPESRVITWAHGMRCFQKIATLLSSYFYEDNSLLRGLP